MKLDSWMICQAKTDAKSPCTYQQSNQLKIIFLGLLGFHFEYRTVHSTCRPMIHTECQAVLCYVPHGNRKFHHVLENFLSQILPVAKSVNYVLAKNVPHGIELVKISLFATLLLFLMFITVKGTSLG